MAAITPGRRTHDHEGDVVVFLIGMRINRLRAVRSWLPVMSAMPAMLRELDADPSLGLLGYTQHLSPRGALVVQYWRDRESLLRYAHAADQAHRPAWAAFNRQARQAAGVVGIWHETFVVPAGGLESLYVNMPSVGLPAAVGSTAVGSRPRSATDSDAALDAGKAGPGVTGAGQAGAESTGESGARKTGAEVAA